MWSSKTKEVSRQLSVNTDNSMWAVKCMFLVIQDGGWWRLKTGGWPGFLHPIWRGQMMIMKIMRRFLKKVHIASFSCTLSHDIALSLCISLFSEYHSYCKALCLILHSLSRSTLHCSQELQGHQNWRGDRNHRCCGGSPAEVWKWLVARQVF